MVPTRRTTEGRGARQKMAGRQHHRARSGQEWAGAAKGAARRPYHAGVSEFGDDPGEDPFEGSNPFQGLPIFGDLAKMFQQQGPMSWDAARQFALSIATGGAAEPNVDPVDRIKIDQLARVAELQVANATGLSPSSAGAGLTILPVNRTTWTKHTLDAYRPLFEILAGSLSREDGGTAAVVDPNDPSEFMAPFMKMIGPMMIGLTAGSMVGHQAQRSFGQYDLPIPRPPSDRLLLIMPNLDEFGREWSLVPDDLRLWVCLHEVTHHAVFGVPHVRQRFDALLREFLAGFQPDAGRLEDSMGGFENLDLSRPDAFQQLLGNPEVVLGAIQSPAQRELLPRLEALVCVIVGYVDHVMDAVGSGLVSSYAMLSEAVRRRRVEASASDRFVSQLFGLEMTQATYDRGAAFIDGVVQRTGEEALTRLWQSERDLPTPAEVDAPGLWLARIDLPSDD
jgi:putative hydrolase